MTEPELVERIEAILKIPRSYFGTQNYENVVSAQIVALIREAQPEIAKNWGWINPEEHNKGVKE